jgi:hypothetical protein
VTTYYISQFPRAPLRIEIETDPPPCLFCDRPVTLPSTDGPLVCGACDCGHNQDGSRWTDAQRDERWAHRRARITEYRAAAATAPREEDENDASVALHRGA